jgi:FkbM family methyltransferase
MSICIFGENEISKIHNKYYKLPIENKNGINNIDYDKSYLEKVVASNFQFIIHKNDGCIADCLRSGQLYEKFFVTYIRHYINPNKNIIDLGANIGTHSVIYSNYTNGTVYSFEPQKTVFDILSKNIQLNNCKNVVPFNFGASNTNSVFYMNAYYDKYENQGAFRIDESLNESNGLKIECKVIDELGLTNIGYIKIDVEGHEYKALQGMEQLIIRDKPIIMIEIHDSCPDKNDTISLLVKLGYNKHCKLSHCDYIFLLQ